MPRKHKKPVDYFVYKTKPFRPLYMGGADFRIPPTSRHSLHIWLFRIRNTARLMAAANKAEYAPIADYPDLITERKRPATRPITRTKLEDLA